MRGFLFSICLLAIFVSGCAVCRKGNLEAECGVNRKGWSHFEGSTDEPSCGGNSLSVYLAGEHIEKIEYFVETSREGILREYYLKDSQPVLVVETVHSLVDKNGDRRRRAKEVSRKRFLLTSPVSEKGEEFVRQGNYLAGYFRAHVKEFAVVARE